MMRKLLLIIPLTVLLFSCGDENVGLEQKESKNLREEVVERHDGGDKKIVAFYDGEGNNEVIVKRVYYYSQNDGGGKEKEENYKNGKLHGKYFEWEENGLGLNGDKSIDCTYNNGKLEGKYTQWSCGVLFVECNYVNNLKDGEEKEYDILGEGELLYHKVYTNGEVTKRIK